MFDIKSTSLNFILSTGRTGSTLLSSILNMHPGILCAVEEPFAYYLYPKYKNVTTWDDTIIETYCEDFFVFSAGFLEFQFGTKNDLITILKKNREILSAVNAIKLTYFAFFPDKNKENITTIVDKQLNYQHNLDELSRNYIDSKFIILVRDPRDNVFLKQKLFLKNHKKRDVYILSKSWDEIYTVTLKKSQQIGTNRFLFLKYEDLVSDPETELKKTCHFLGINYDPSILNFREATHALNDKINNFDEQSKSYYSYALKSLTENINTKKIDIWKKELTTPQSDLIWSICSETAIKYGYSANGSKKIFYSDFFFANYYLIFLLRKTIIRKLYKALPISLKFAFKKLLYSKSISALEKRYI